ETSSVLVNRATSGYYMPGSTFKIVDALAAYRQYGTGIEDSLYYDCEGAVTLQDAVTVEELRVACDSDIAHGTVNMRGAFARSCNGYFITLGSQLDLRTWRETAEDLLYNGEIDFALSNASGRFTLDGESGTWETMLTAIGQGDTLVTPLQNAMISAAVANGGTVMRPVIVNEIRTSGGTHVRDFRYEEMAQLMTEDEAAYLRELMTAVVNEGTATNMQSPYYQAAGKTGTAQNTSAPGDSNALFTGFAPADAAPGERQIVVSVVVENGGRVHGSATEIASAIFDEWLVNR
ncbi:MAG: penicillin-binding protein 2, partial [Lachnospiraceae bacterium]|nr:penicillin-binding protein 2 [Lachnospiraceae bacterium]